MSAASLEGVARRLAEPPSVPLVLLVAAALLFALLSEPRGLLPPLAALVAVMDALL